MEAGISDLAPGPPGRGQGPAAQPARGSLRTASRQAGRARATWRIRTPERARRPRATGRPGSPLSAALRVARDPNRRRPRARAGALRRGGRAAGGGAGDPGRLRRGPAAAGAEHPAPASPRRRPALCRLRLFPSAAARREPKHRLPLGDRARSLRRPPGPRPRAMLLLVGTGLVAFVLLLYMLSPLISPKPLALPGAHVVVSGPLRRAPLRAGAPAAAPGPAPARGLGARPPPPRAPRRALGAGAPPAIPARPRDGLFLSSASRRVHREAEKLCPGRSGEAGKGRAGALGAGRRPREGHTEPLPKAPRG